MWDFCFILKFVGCREANASLGSMNLKMKFKSFLEKTKTTSLPVVASGCSRGFSIEHQPIRKENEMIISRLYKSVNPNTTITLVVILDSNKIKCTNAYQY